MSKQLLYWIAIAPIVILSGCLNTDSVYRISPGMSRQEVYRTLGKPNRIEVCGDMERWYYQPKILGSHYQYLEVTFDNNRVANYINPGIYALQKRDLVGLPDFGSLPGTEMTFTDPFNSSYYKVEAIGNQGLFW